MKKEQTRNVTFLFLPILLLGNLLLAHSVPRTSFLPLVLLYGACFLALIGLMHFHKNKASWIPIFLIGLHIRLLIGNAAPLWSEDYVRFLWDGELLAAGQNPYLLTPFQWNSEVVSQHAFFQEAYPLLNSPRYYTVYPPLAQLVFSVVGFLSSGEVAQGILILRVVLILLEIAVFFVMLKLMNSFSVPVYWIGFYWLHPFVIQEITGNLHLEGIVLLFLLLSLWAMVRSRLVASGAFLGLSIGVKLVPLILLPSLVGYGKTRRSRFFWIGVGGVVLVSFAPLLWKDAWINFLHSVRLFQGTFEFNASFYYLARELGYWLVGYNTIAFLTKGFALLTFFLIVGYSLRKSAKTTAQLVDVWVMAYLLYLLLQPVVHPWYMLPLLGISLLRKRVFGILWAFSLIFSYEAYRHEPPMEQLLYLGLEYGILALGIAWDYVPWFKKSCMRLFRQSSRLFFPVFLLLFACAQPEDWAAKELIQKSIEAHGGAENWKKLEELSFQKSTRLFTKDGNLEKETKQLIHLKFVPQLSGEIQWVQDSVLHVLGMSEGQISYAVGGNPIENTDFLKSKKEDFLAMYYAFAQPWNLLEEEGSTLHYEGLRQTALGKAEVLRVFYGPGEDTWWYYFDPESHRMLGNEIQLKDHRSLVSNLDFSTVSPFIFYKTRESHRVDSLGNRLYLRALYLYEDYQLTQRD